MGKDVLVVEDILDTGLTMNFLKKHFEKKMPRSIKFCVFIDKKRRRKMPFEADYCCFTIDDGFVVGYGLDYGESYRNLPHIAVMDDEGKE